MPDETPSAAARRAPSPSTSPSPSSPQPTRGSSSGFSVPPAPSGAHAIRRAATFDETRRRPGFVGRGSGDMPPPQMAPRRSSNFSDYSLGEARDLLNPKVPTSGQLSPAADPESSSLASLSLAFALLPAVGGALFKNGSAVITDVMLLGLAGIFLHWSVTQPWSWYHSAQQVRVQHESGADAAAVADDSDAESLGGQPKAGVTLDDVPEDEATLPAGHSDVDVDAAPRMTTQQQSATSELYTYEILALFACFGCPLLSAYLLHAIRAQLSRPSEGLVSNYNLTIFLLVSELRVFSHMLKLLQARTLHLQRIVNANPYRSASGTGGDAERLDDILARLASLETKPTTQEPLPPRDPKADSAEKTKQEAAITRDVRNSIQPELDALNRAVRRYEKKATLLQYQTESRFSAVEARLDDAIALAAAAAKNSASHQNSLAWAIDSLVRILLFPFNAIVKILLLPLHALQALLSRKKPASAAVKTSRAGRSSSGKAPAQARYSGDRVPSRVSKR